jgi:cytochrome b561
MKYSLTMRAFHWTMSVIVLCLLGVGIYMAGLPGDAPHKYDWYFWHKSFGMVILGLVFLRVALRSQSALPPPVPGLSHFEHKAAVASHRFMYLLLIIVPVCGYIMSSTFMQSKGVSFFGWFTFPSIIPKSDATSALFKELHKIFAFTLLGMIVLHVLAVIKHRYYDKKDVLKRML